MESIQAIPKTRGNGDGGARDNVSRAMICRVSRQLANPTICCPKLHTRVTPSYELQSPWLPGSVGWSHSRMVMVVWGIVKVVSKDFCTSENGWLLHHDSGIHSFQSIRDNGIPHFVLQGRDVGCPQDGGDVDEERGVCHVPSKANPASTVNNDIISAMKIACALTSVQTPDCQSLHEPKHKDDECQGLT